MRRQDVTQELVREHFESRDGCLFWIKRPPNHRGTSVVGNRFGSPTGTIGPKDYRGGSFLSNIWLEHRLMFMYHHGYLPKQIDHINRDTLDNRIENLRECTHGQNQHNKEKRRNTASRYFGLTWSDRRKKWIPQIGVDGRSIYLGGYEDEEEAARVRDDAARRYHGEFAHLNFPKD